MIGHIVKIFATNGESYKMEVVDIHSKGICGEGYMLYTYDINPENDTLYFPWENVVKLERFS